MNKLNVNNRIKHLVLIEILTLFLLFSASSVSANVGKIVYGYGSNHAYDSDGNRRALSKGSIVNEGDTLVTGRGRMHVRLIDGGFISVYPNTEYKIDKFKYSGKNFNDRENKTAGKAADKKATARKPQQEKESKEDRGFFSLLKGAARQVTGLLGRTYNENFKLRTSVATIGIRGTGFFAKLCQADCFDAEGNPLQDGMYVKNNTGVITMTTNVGNVALAQGQSAFAASNEDSPLQVIQPPVAYNIVTPDLELYDFVEQVVDTLNDLYGDDLPIIPNIDPPVDPPNILISKLEYVTSTGLLSPAPLGGIDTANPADSLTQTGDAIEHFEGTGVYIGALPLVFDKGTAILAESGSDTNLGVLWNRWSGGFVFEEGGTPVSIDNNVHLIGSDNMTADLAGLSGRGQVDYVSSGGTNPTITGFAASQTGTQMINASILYGTNEVTNFQIDVDFGSTSVGVNLNPVTATFLSGTSGNLVDLTGSCTGPECGGNGLAVSGRASINLVGSNAEGIYGVYNLTSIENAISGSYVATDSAIPVAIKP